MTDTTRPDHSTIAREALAQALRDRYGPRNHHKFWQDDATCILATLTADGWLLVNEEGLARAMHRREWGHEPGGEFCGCGWNARVFDEDAAAIFAALRERT